MHGHCGLQSAVKAAVYVLLALLLLAGIAHGQTASSDRLTVGGSKLRPDSTTTVRLDGLATTGGTLVLLTDADGDVTERVLAVGDIPAPFTRDDVAEAITQAWDFTAGLTGDLSVAGVISSSATTGLPSTVAGTVYLGGGFSSPAAGRLYIGDGTGWKLHIASRNSGTTTDRFTFGDTGRFEFAEHLLPQAGYFSNLGSLQKKLLTIHAAELWVETLVAQDTIATIGGRVLVGPTTVLVADLAAAGTTITVKHNQMASGDRAYLEADGKVEFLAITSSAGGTAGAYTYSVTRNLDGSGANDWYAGDAVFNTGTTGDGFIDLYSVRGVKSGSEAGPTIVGNVRLSGTYNNWAPRWAIGNLDGLYGISTTTYGVALGDPTEANSLMTAGDWRLRHGTTDKIVLDGSTGDMTLTGDILLSTGGNIESTGNFSLNETVGLSFADSTGSTDFPRMVWWSGGSYVRGAGSSLFLTTGLGVSSAQASIALVASPSVGGAIAFSSYNGSSTSSASFETHSSGASTLLAGSIYPSTGASLVDGTATLGLYLARYDNINLALDPNPDTAPAFVIVNKGGGGADANSALGYIAGLSGSVTKVMGACTVTIKGGVITAVTGC